ncbi:MAG: SIMPL domain-containing protein [Chloroflexi bacterium]|nr:SIMPL domain-containing protein [Chloroflexota bacterium]
MRFSKGLILGLSSLLVVLLATACRQTTVAAPSPASPGGAPPVVQAAAYSPLSPGSASQTGIWVSGTGRVLMEPDLALLTIGVEARERTVEAARSKAAAAMAAIVEVLKARGIAGKDVQTSGFSISPEYTFRERERILVGYLVNNQARIKVRKLDEIGRVIDEVARAGGDLTLVQGISFTVENPAPFQSSAREQAVRDALAKAQQFAALTGVTLGRLVYLTESTVASVPREFGVRSLAAAEATTPISGGELEITVTVQVAFAIP